MARITEESINRVKDADILQLIGSFVKLKRAGVNHTGCCPFHNEKSPSFVVSEAKGMFKCFGCGENGDAIGFVEKHEKMEFIEAVEKIADICGIRLDYEEESEKQVKERVDREQLRAALKLGHGKYHEQLFKHADAHRYLNEQRGYSDDIIREWGLGWAPNEWRWLAAKLDEENMTAAGITTSILKQKDASREAYDFYKGRIIFPVYDANGNVVTLGGRIMPGVNYGEGQHPPKYLNGADSPLYNKSRVLYGLNKAVRSIRQMGFGILTEGYTDVISQHKAGNTNTVATCGTSLTPEHIALMKRYSENWWIMRDSDAAGIKALLRDVPMLIGAQVNVRVVMLPKGEDPDSITRGMDTYNEAGGWNNDISVTLGFDWLCQYHLHGKKLDIAGRAEAIGSLIEVVAMVKNEFVRGTYAQILANISGEKKATIEKIVKEQVKTVEKDLDEDEDAIPLPDWADEDEVMKWGFVERRDPKHCGYYFLGGSRSLTQQTSFILKPLYHIVSQTDNRRLFEVTNGRDTKMVEIPSKSVLSVDQFCGLIYDAGVFLAEGTYNKMHHMKLLKKLSPDLPMAYELVALGWQAKEGFFAFSNKIYKPATTINEEGKLEEYDEYGIVKVDGGYFYSPSKSKINADIRSDEDHYENDKYLLYKDPPVSFAEWCTLIVDTYEQHGWIMIPYVIGTLFRDIIISTTPLPHLYPYGMVNSGKSQIGESINNFFFSGKDVEGKLYKPFNLAQGTIYAFFNRMGRFINCPNVLNEFDDNSINEDFFRAIKAAYDGEGREKGMKDKNKATVQKIRCSLVIMGQFLGTKDENSVLTRSLPLAIKAVAQSHRTDKQLAAYDRLKALENEGLGGVLIELLNKRSLYKKKFNEVFSDCLKEMTADLKSEETQPQPRILKNYCCMLSIVMIAATEMKLPFTVAEFRTYAKESIKMMTALVSRTSGVSEFWSTVEFLLDRGLIHERKDFLVEDGATGVKLSGGKGEDGKYITDEKSFQQAKNLLFIRLSGVHKLYQEQNRKAGGKNPLNEQTLLLYMKEQPYFIGWVHAKKMGKATNSCFVFDYDMLNINLKKSEDTETPVVVVVGEIVSDIMKTSLPGKSKFIVKELGESKRPDGTTQTNQFVYQCFSNDPFMVVGAMKGNHIQMRGTLDIHINYEKEQRFLDVIDYEVVAAGEMFTKDFGAVTPVADKQATMSFEWGKDT